MATKVQLQRLGSRSSWIFAENIKLEVGVCLQSYNLPQKVEQAGEEQV